MEKKKTQRGFEYYAFRDRYDVECSIQKSSLATQDAIWFGVDNPDPKVMAVNADKVGVKTDETVGWVDFPIPEEVLLKTRMHLTRKQVKKLLPILKKFVKTGEI